MSQKEISLDVSASSNPSYRSTKIIASLNDAGTPPATGTPITFSVSGNAFFSNGYNTIQGYLVDGRAEQIVSVTEDEVVTVEVSSLGLTNTVQITFTSEPVLGAISVMAGGYTFSPENEFPTTGFSSARGLFYINGTANEISQYKWNSDQEWVSVDGNFYFIGEPTPETKNVKITAQPLSGIGRIYQYNFSVSKWFINNGGVAMNWSDTSDLVAQMAGYSLATVQDINGSSNYSAGIRGVIGSVWAEWGNMPRYDNSSFVPGGYWSSEKGNEGSHYFVNLDGGECAEVIDNAKSYGLIYKYI